MNLAIYLVLFALLFSCASGHQQTSAKLRLLVQSKQYDEAITFIKESSLATDKKSALLFQTELGLIQHYKGDYQASIQSLTEAKNILDTLFTTKASGKLASFMSNDNADYYYSEKYEASLVFFYLALNHFQLGQLEKARAEILAWDSFITEMKNDRAGKIHFKDDLLAKTFGAFIHEYQNTTQDDQVALQLYKDASDVFFKNYNLYPTFNKSFKDFRSNFSLFPKLQKQEVEGKYVFATDHTSTFQEFLTLKILQLTKKVRPSDFQAQVQKLRLSKEILARVSDKMGQLTFLVQDGLIVQKEAKKYEFPMVWGAYGPAAIAMGTSATIQFELSEVKSLPQLELAKLKAFNEKNELVREVPLSVIAPLDDMAEQAINEHSAAIAGKTAARVAAKHIAAFLSAQAVIRSAKNSDAAGISLLFGTLGHAAAIAAINESEKADVRFWSTLPSNIRMGQLSLPQGSYRIQATFGQEGSPFYKVVELGSQKIEKGSVKLVTSQSHQTNALYLSSTREIQINDMPSPTVTESTIDGSGKSLSRDTASSAGCKKDADCFDGKVCATVRGYPGSCASR
jgi:hypothetical protein